MTFPFRYGCPVGVCLGCRCACGAGCASQNGLKDFREDIVRQKSVIRRLELDLMTHVQEAIDTREAMDRDDAASQQRETAAHKQLVKCPFVMNDCDSVPRR